MQKNIVLYSSEFCPYCERVELFLKENKIDVEKIYLESAVHIRDDLISIGGMAQVPCLVIEGQALYESEDIVQWFADQYNIED